MIPELGRSPGKGNGYPLQYAGLENSMDSIVHRAARSRTRLSHFRFHCFKEDDMVGWYHQLNGHEFEQTPGDSEGQGSLAYCSPQGRQESDMT